VGGSVRRGGLRSRRHPANANTDTHCNGQRHLDANENANADCHRYGEPYTNANTDTHCNGQRHLDANENANADCHRYGEPYTNANTDTHCNGHPHLHANGDTDRHPDPDAVTYGDTDSDSKPNRRAYTHAYADRDAHVHCNGDRYALRHGNTNKDPGAGLPWRLQRQRGGDHRRAGHDGQHRPRRPAPVGLRGWRLDEGWRNHHRRNHSGSHPRVERVLSCPPAASVDPKATSGEKSSAVMQAGGGSSILSYPF
jgi:hypothetical protein